MRPPPEDPAWPLVVVHGPPGAGKSCLARSLAEATGLPHFDRDEFKDSMFAALGYSDRAWSAQVGGASWQLLQFVAERLIAARISLIVESNFSPGQTLDALRDAARAVMLPIASVHVTACDEVLWQRFHDRRMSGGRHPGHAGFESREEFLAEIARRSYGPFDLGASALTIDTSASWPEVPEVVAWLRRVAAA